MSVSADIEMVRPALGDEGIFGVEGAGVPGKWGWRLGVDGGYERAPVLVITEGVVTSRPVAERVGGWAGFSLGLGRHVAVQAFVPVAWQVGDDAALSADGAGLGDPRVGARWGILDGQVADATLRADVHLPLGRRDAWMGEDAARADFGVSGALHGGFGALLVDVGIVARPLESPQPRLDWGPTGELGLGVRADVSPRFSAGVSWVARAVLAGLDRRDGELASELLASARLEATPAVAIAAGGGAGLQEGVGVPTFRGFATFTFAGTVSRKALPPEPVVVDEEPPPTTAQLLEEIPGVTDDPPPPPPVAMARVEGDEIQFREQIQFVQGSAELLPASHAVLDAVAELLAADGRIAHLAIEGHTSEEGDLVTNWDLSDRRARAVWEALVLDGVSPERMSWRGVGEVIPAVAGASQAARIGNRRVVMRIARRLALGEALPATPSSALLPWNGDPIALDAVSIPDPTPPPPPPGFDRNTFKEDDE